MSMKIDKLNKALNQFFSLDDSDKNKEEHQIRLLKSIKKLELNKLELEDQIKQQDINRSKDNKNKEQYNNLLKKYKVVTKLLKKAKKSYLK